MKITELVSYHLSPLRFSVLYTLNIIVSSTSLVVQKRVPPKPLGLVSLGPRLSASSDGLFLLFLCRPVMVQCGQKDN